MIRISTFYWSFGLYAGFYRGWQSKLFKYGEFCYHRINVNIIDKDYVRLFQTGFSHSTYFWIMLHTFATDDKTSLVSHGIDNKVVCDIWYQHSSRSNEVRDTEYQHSLRRCVLCFRRVISVIVRCWFRWNGDLWKLIVWTT